MRQSGKAHGVYLRNSNGMDVIYGDGYLMYRVIGGLCDYNFSYQCQCHEVFITYRRARFILQLHYNCSNEIILITITNYFK